MPSATTAAILGLPVPAKKKTAKRTARKKGPAEEVPGNVRQEWVKYYKALISLRNRLADQMSGLASESAQEIQGYSLHMADSGTDNFDRDFALSLLSSDQDAMYEIEEALKRIEKETYGICEMTGKPIPKARLDAVPWARFTVEAQAQLEKDGAQRQRRLGKLGTIDSTGPREIEEEEEPEPKRNKQNKD